MKKMLLVAAMLVAVLAFLAIPKSQAGAAKPIRWTATIMPVEGDSLIEPTTPFVGGVNHVNINNGSGSNDTPCSVTGTSGAYSYLELQLFTPCLKFSMSGFSGVDVLPSPYGFPKTNAPWPGCIEDFLNNNLHPTPEYAHVILRFTTCGCGNTKTDLMAMTDGETLPVHMMFLFFTHNWYTVPKSSTPYPYLNLMMNAHGTRTPLLGGDFDVKIQKTTVNGKDTWTAYVDTQFDNPQYPATNLIGYNSNDWPEIKTDSILGQYATYVGSGKNAVTTYHYPYAKAPLKFQIAFTKN